MFEKILNKIPWLKHYENRKFKLKYYPDSLYSKINEVAHRYPQNIALEYFKTHINYENFLLQVDMVASALKKQVKENDFVTICCTNTPEAIYSFYAINKIGAIANMVHPLSSKNEIENFVNNTKSKIIFVNDVMYDKVKDLDVKKIIVIPIDNSMDNLTKLGYRFINRKHLLLELEEKNHIFYNDYIKKCDLSVNSYVPRKDYEDAVVLYSGGTTGNPKGVVLSNLCLNALSLQCHTMIDGTEAGNSILSYLPIFHGFGLAICIHTPLYLGMKCILIPKLDTKKITRTISKKKPNFVPVVPSLLELLIKEHSGRKSLQSVICILSGGDALKIELKEKAEKHFRKHGSKAYIRIGYGLTECTASTCVSQIKNYKKDSIGIPFPDTYYRVVKTNTDIDADYGELGEILISGPTVMKRYLNNDEETMRTLTRDDKGKMWLHTGDIGSMDKDGMFYFHTRLKRVIISNGFNIYPNYIEEVFNKCPLIETSVIIGVKDKVKQQVVKAIIVLKKNIIETEDVREKIKKYAKDNIAKYALPKYYEFRKKLPKNAIGKISIKELQN